MKIDLSQFRDTYLQESDEQLATMEACLLELREALDDSELLNAIFRAAHTIKGGAGSFGLTHVVRFTHTLETLLDRLRSLEIPATAAIVALLLQAVDVLQGLLKLEPDSEMSAEAVSLLHQLESHTAVTLTAAAAPLVLLAPQKLTSKDYRIEFLPSRDMLQSGTNPIVLLRNLRWLGTVKETQIHTDHLPTLHDLDPATFYLRWTVTLTTDQGEDDIREVFEFVEHLAEIRISVLSNSEAQRHEEVDVRPKEDQYIEPPQTEPPKVPVVRAPNDRRQQPSSVETSSIRVSTEKVDMLIDLVGQLVIANVMIKQLTEAFAPATLPQLREAVSAMERNIRELHERVMGVRMIAVGTLFQRFKRTVFDIAQSTGKQIRLETAGDETEIDKSLLELLGDSMIHLVRNAADHGIESAEERERAGKPAEGTIRLSARHRAGKMAITISDDGAGIDPERVRARALQRGLITPKANLTDEEIQMLIFAPGFSTRDQVSDLSGRGVGMDVVKRNVEKLSGVVTLSSEPGHGSSVNIELPLTLAIMEGLLVGVDNRVLVLPLLSVTEVVCPTSAQMVSVAGQGEVLNLRNENIPILHVRRFLYLEMNASRVEPTSATRNNKGISQVVVIVEASNKKLGLIVDEIVGQQQVVLKSLESNFHKVNGLMGVTILGDGCVAPVVDVNELSSLNLLALRKPEQHPGMDAQGYIILKLIKIGDSHHEGVQLS